MIAHRRKHGHDLKPGNKQYYARTILTAKSGNKSIETLTCQLIQADDAAAVFDHVNEFAALPTAELAKAKTNLKGHFGQRLDLTSFNASIKEKKQEAQRQVKVENSELSSVINVNRQMRYVEQDAVKALVDANDPPVTFVRDKKMVKIPKDENGLPYIAVLSVPSMRSLLSSCADFLNRNGADVLPPKEIAESILSSGEWPSLPGLNGITETPVLRRDGSILDQAGYDAKTQLCFIPATDFELLSIPERPTQADAVEAAKYILDEVLGDFLFVDDGSRANALAAFITPAVRVMINGSVPIALIDAPAAGSGKSLLIDCSSVAATGRPGQMLGAPKGDEEMEKVLVSELIKGSPLIVFDNVDIKLQAAPLARAVTARTFTGRILAKNKTVDLPVESTFYCTGNNIQLGGDMPRRCYWVRLDPKMAHPELRTEFRHPRILEWVTANRPAIVRAQLIMGRAWFVANNRPIGKIVIGSFESFCEIVGGILEYAGVDGFLDNYKRMVTRSDSITEAWEPFLIKLHDLYGSEDFRVSDLYRTISEDFRENELALSLPESVYQKFVDKERRGFVISLGKAFKGIEGRRIGDQEYCLERGEPDAHTNSQKWRIRKYK